jgi:hypothetical protein
MIKRRFTPKNSINIIIPGVVTKNPFSTFPNIVIKVMESNTKISIEEVVYDTTPHKITGKLDDSILQQLHYNVLAKYVHKTGQLTLQQAFQSFGIPSANKLKSPP